MTITLTENQAAVIRAALSACASGDIAERTNLTLRDVWAASCGILAQLDALHSTTEEN